MHISNYARQFFVDLGFTFSLIVIFHKIFEFPDQSHVFLHNKSIRRGPGPSKLIFSSKIRKKLIVAVGVMAYLDTPKNICLISILAQNFDLGEYDFT